MLHPKFKINNQSFQSADELRLFAEDFKVRSEENYFVGKFILEWLNANNFIEVQTSGSTGKPKNIILRKTHVENSAQATNLFFNLVEGTSALLCLSAQYIAGKMMLVRAMIGGWNLTTTAPEKNPLRSFNQNFDFTAMVPFQVHHSLDDLEKVKKVIIGGGTIPANLEKNLQEKNTLAFATYGMTETISHIAVRQVNGREKTDSYIALPDVSFSQTAEGCLVITAPKISDEVQITNDIVELLSETEFLFLGRKDNVINSGGIKIHPEEVERKLSQIIRKPFFVASEKDEELGEKLILIIESGIPVSKEDLQEAFEQLSAYEKPKKVYTLPQFVYTDTEKIKRKDVIENLNNLWA